MRPRKSSLKSPRTCRLRFSENNCFFSFRGRARRRRTGFFFFFFQWRTRVNNNSHATHSHAGADDFDLFARHFGLLTSLTPATRLFRKSRRRFICSCSSIRSTRRRCRINKRKPRVCGCAVATQKIRSCRVRRTNDKSKNELIKKKNK